MFWRKVLTVKNDDDQRFNYRWPYQKRNFDFPKNVFEIVTRVFLVNLFLGMLRVVSVAVLQQFFGCSLLC